MPESSTKNGQSDESRPHRPYRLLISIGLLVVVAVGAVAVWLYLPVNWPDALNPFEEGKNEPLYIEQPRAAIVDTPPQDPQSLDAELLSLRQTGMQIREQIRKELALLRAETLLLSAERAFIQESDPKAVQKYLHQAMTILAASSSGTDTVKLQELIESDVAAVDRYVSRSSLRALPLINAMLEQYSVPENPTNATSPTVIHKILDYLPGSFRESVTIRKVDNAGTANKKLLEFLLVARIAVLDNNKEKFQTSLDSIERLTGRERDASFVLLLNKLRELEIEWQRPRLRTLQSIRDEMK